MFSREYFLTVVCFCFGNFIAGTHALEYGYTLAKALTKWQVNFEDYDVNVRNLWCLLEVSHKCNDSRSVRVIVFKRVSFIVKLGYVFLTLVLIQHWLFQSQQWKHQGDVWNLFKVNLVSLLLTLNRFHTLFWCFHCWLRSSKWQRWRRITKMRNKQTASLNTWDLSFALVTLKINWQISM